MTRYLSRRVGSALLTLFLFVTFLFFVINVLVPGDWTSQFILTEEQRAALQEQVGLDRSLWDQYWTWLKGLGTLELGVSFAGFEVWGAVKDAMGTTLLVFLTGMAIAFPIGNWLGRNGAWRGRGWFLGATSFAAVVFFTAFPPSLAFLLDRGLRNATSPGTYSDIVTLDRDLWTTAAPPRPGVVNVEPFPEAEALSPPDVLWRLIVTLLVLLVAAVIVDRILWRLRRRRLVPVAAVVTVFGGAWAVVVAAGWGSYAADILGTVSLLALGVIVIFYGELQLVTEAAMEDAVDEDHVLTARAKGLPERTVRDRHAARTALLPVLSRLVVSLPYFLTGLAILESVFQVPGGLGNLVFNAVRNQDTPVVVGTMVVVGVVSLAARLLLDVLHLILDPRIRYASGGLEADVG